jgi:hypothetical protein
VTATHSTWRSGTYPASSSDGPGPGGSSARRPELGARVSAGPCSGTPRRRTWTAGRSSKWARRSRRSPSTSRRAGPVPASCASTTSIGRSRWTAGLPRPRCGRPGAGHRRRAGRRRSCRQARRCRRAVSMRSARPRPGAVPRRRRPATACPGEDHQRDLVEVRTGIVQQRGEVVLDHRRVLPTHPAGRPPITTPGNNARGQHRNNTRTTPGDNTPKRRPKTTPEPTSENDSQTKRQPDETTPSRHDNQPKTTPSRKRHPAENDSQTKRRPAENDTRPKRHPAETVRRWRACSRRRATSATTLHTARPR